MNKEFKEILSGFKQTLHMLEKPEKNMLLFATVLMLINGILTNLPAVILGRFVDKIVNVKQFQFSTATPFIILIILIILVREALTVVRKYFVENVATQTEKKQTVNAVNNLLKTDLTFLGEKQIGSLHGRLFRSIQGLIRVIKLGFLDFFPAFFSALAAIGIALIQKPFLASVMILVIPAGIYIIVKQISSQKGIRVALLRGKEKIDGAVVEMLGGIETVRTLNTTDQEVGKIGEISEDLRKKEIKHHIQMALFDAAKYLNEGFFYILVISLSILFSAQGVISRGDILVYSILFISITSPLREIHRILDQAHEGSILVNDLYDLLNQPQDISFRLQQNKRILKQEDIVSIKNLSFSYKNKPNQKILSTINLSIRKGEKLGIAGASGCGKTTLIKIMLRLIHDYDGMISLFNKDLLSITRKEIAKKISYVPQKTYVFYGSVRENVTYGRKSKIDEKEIIQATKRANIHDEIINSLGGLNGRVSENGNNLSGGQKQRLAIARLMLMSPEILIFDEATSALDNTNEAIIQRNIESMFKDKTMITIAHRLTTLQNCDRIIVIDKGRIVQEGSFNELSRKEGLFRDFLEGKKEY